MPVQLYNSEMVDMLRSIFPARGEVPFWSQGTWTPEITGAGSNPTITYSTQDGKYTNIGDLCFWAYRIVVSSSSGGSGGMRISLPFLANAEGSTFSVRTNNLTVSGTPIGVVFSVSNGNAYGNVRTLYDGGGAAVVAVTNVTTNTILESSGSMFI
jgi:hypothetical protein